MEGKPAPNCPRPLGFASFLLGDVPSPASSLSTAPSGGLLKQAPTGPRPGRTQISTPGFRLPQLSFTFVSLHLRTPPGIKCRLRKVFLVGEDERKGKRSGETGRSTQRWRRVSSRVKGRGVPKHGCREKPQKQVRRFGRPRRSWPVAPHLCVCGAWAESAVIS